MKTSQIYKRSYCFQRDPSTRKVLCSLWPQFPCPCNGWEAMEFSRSSSSRGDTAFATPAVRRELCLVPGGGHGARPGEQEPAALDATNLCGPSAMPAGAGQGPGWTGIRVLLGGLPLCPATFPWGFWAELRTPLFSCSLVGEAESQGWVVSCFWPESGVAGRLSHPLPLQGFSGWVSLHRPLLSPLHAGWSRGGIAPLRRLCPGAPSPSQSHPGRRLAAYPCCRPRSWLCCSTSW